MKKVVAKKPVKKDVKRSKKITKKTVKKVDGNKKVKTVVAKKPAR